MINKTIVIVETDPSVLEILTIALNDYGYKVIGTPYYQDGFTLVSLTKPALVIIEFKIKGYEAIEMLKQLRTIDPKLILLAISCNSDIGTSYSTNGFNGFIPKPFEIDELFKTVERHFACIRNSYTSRN